MYKGIVNYAKCKPVRKVYVEKQDVIQRNIEHFKQLKEKFSKTELGD